MISQLLEGRVLLPRGLYGVLWKALLPVAVFSFVVAGYFLTYHLFFLELPLEDVASKRLGAVEENFRFDGVVYFKGMRLNDKAPLTMRYRVPRVVSLAGDKKVELFIRIDTLEDSPESSEVGTLIYSQNGKPEIIKLKNKTLQRFLVSWQPTTGVNNVFRFVFKASNPRIIDHIVFATNIKNVGLLNFFFLFSLLGAGLLACWAWKRGGLDLRTSALILGCVLFMYVVHSGAFISNEYFSGNHGKVAGMASHVGKALSNGHFSETLYRGTGFALLPLVTGVVEGSFKKQGLLNVYPTSRYLMFVWGALSLSYLLLVIRKQFGVGTALILGLLYATFHPFIIDMYSPDADAYFIPLMTLLVALFIKLCVLPTGGYKLIAGMGIVMIAMISVKVTPVFLVLLIPLSLWGHTIVTKRTFGDKRALVTLVVLLLCAMGGSYAAKAFQHPDRNVGMAGVAFQKHVGWHMLWAAYGIYDHHSAHWFTKSNKLRRQRVEDATGIPRSVQYVHQSQLATDELYKPSVLRALDERPGFFYSTASLRFYNHALTFFRYNSAYSKMISSWLDDGFDGRERISGEDVCGLKRERSMIRYGKMWKLSPLVLVTKIEYGDMSRMTDIVLICMAFVGVFCLKRADMVVFFVGCGLAKFGFNSVIHVMIRYTNFCNIALLIGLSVCISLIIRALWNASSQELAKH